MIELIHLLIAMGQEEKPCVIINAQSKGGLPSANIKLQN